MNIIRSTRIVAIIEALFATFIWASSFVFVKILLVNIGPLTIAGLRYFLAFFVLLPFIIRKSQALQDISQRTWAHLALIGLSAYAIGNGAMFWGLKFLPATTTSFLMGISPLLILFAGVIFLKEIPSRLQLVGLVISLIGNAIFFSSGLRPGEPIGIAIVALGLLGFTTFGILGRGVAREKRTSTIILTGIPLGIGGGVLLLLGVPLEGRPIFDLKTLFMILWLAIVNTAVAYVLYNHSLKTITALEMNVLLNLSPLGTAVLAWFFLGESLSLVQLLGIGTMILGVSFVQVRQNITKPDHEIVEPPVGTGPSG